MIISGKRKRYFTAALVLLSLCLCSCAKPTSRTQSDIPVLTPAGTATAATTANPRTDEPAAPTNSADPRTDEPATPTNTETPTPRIPDDDELVLIKDYIPDVYIDLKYASKDNFTGKVIYNFTEPTLRYGTVKKLAAVQKELKEKGYCLKIWDAYRPKEAQFKLWEICPDPTYVSDPNKGFSNHSRGNTVDVTIVRADGSEITMPSAFDDFTEKANRDYSDVSDEAKANILILEKAMSEHGFNCYFGEWWHYTDSTTYPVVE